MRRSLSLIFVFWFAVLSIAGLALDGQRTGTWLSGASFTVTSLTTSLKPDVIAAYIAIRNTSLVTVTSISAPGTTGWAQRKQQTFNSTNDFELWYGTAANPLGAVTVTINLSATPQAALASVFGISGANTSVITDPNASLPARAFSSAAATPFVTSVSTSFGNDMIHAGTACAVNSGVTQTASGAGFVLVNSATIANMSIAAEYDVVNVTQSATTVGFGQNCAAPWVIFADAVEQAASAVKSMTLPLLGVGN